MTITIGGWITMILSVGFVTSLLAWSMYKVLVAPDSDEHVHSPVDIEPPDLKDD